MESGPPDLPDTTPELVPTIAIDVLLLLHLPPGVGSDKLIVEPAHTRFGPVIAAGVGMTVTEPPMVQPVPNE